MKLTFFPNTTSTCLDESILHYVSPIKKDIRLTEKFLNAVRHIGSNGFFNEMIG